MIRLECREFDAAEWAERMGNAPSLSLLQTWSYGEAKSRTGSWRAERGVILDGDRPVGAVQALVRKVPFLAGGLVWINRGPVFSELNEVGPDLWREALEVMRRRWVGERRMVLRIAPPRYQLADQDASLPPGFQHVEGGRGYQSSRVDLDPSVEMLRKALEHKWRNALNKAERLGLTLESGTDPHLFSSVLTEYRATLERKGYQTSVTPELLESLQATSRADGTLWSLMARSADDVLGIMMVARYGRTAEYLIGSSSDAGRKVNVGHLLLWRAMNEMKSQGYRWFDLGGMDPERTPAGIFHFKSGVRGTPYALPDEVEACNRGVLSWSVRYAAGRAKRHA